MKLSPFHFWAPFRLTKPETKVQFIKLRSDAQIYALCTPVKVCLGCAFTFLLSPTISLVQRETEKGMGEPCRARNDSLKDFKVLSYSLAPGQEIACKDSSLKGVMWSQSACLHIYCSSLWLSIKSIHAKWQRDTHLYSIEIK